ncbi:hypothetical protein, partial [Sutterella wadsworthensis]|uniref:hypothetical protein n=1 Tax=Sutterella wadsworthensis TaxID=40545 RepID=UPI003AB9B1F4
GQCLLRGEMQKPLAGLLSHFLRYVHGVDSVCVQKIHTTSKPSIKKSTGLREDMPLRGVFTVENQMLQLFDFGRKPFSLKWPHERTSSKKSFKRKGAKEKTTLLGVPYQRGLLFLVFFI